MWTFKKKSNGTRRGRLNTHGFKQKEGVNFKEYFIEAPVTNDITFRAALAIMIVLKLYGGLWCVKGAFLQGKCVGDEKHSCVKIPNVMKKHYSNDACLLLLAPMHGLKNADIAFWMKLIKVMKNIGCERSKADLYYVINGQ